MRQEVEKLFEKGHLKNQIKQLRIAWYHPLYITIKKDKTVKKALDLRKLNEARVKTKTTMSNTEELISKI